MDNKEQSEKSLELPHPVDATGSSVDASGGAEQGQSHEQQVAPSSSAAPTSPVTPAVAPTDPSQIAASLGTAATVPLPSTQAGLKAEDIDLIEKEWVLKAKAIVAQTHGDPYTQNKEINKIRAEYIKKRYNKDIKQSSD